MTERDASTAGRLWGLWALYNGLAFLIILGAVEVLSALSADVTHGAALKGHTVAALIIGVVGALVYAAVLGALQWRVVSELVPVPKRRWISVGVVSALIIWFVFVVPAVIDAANSGGNVREAYLLGVSEGLALGPLLGVGQSFALRPYTTRWAWWIAAMVFSYLIVVAVTYLLSRLFDGIDLQSASTWEIFLMLLATTPLSGRALLWVTAPSARR